jgi:hypothetical protein
LTLSQKALESDSKFIFKIHLTAFSATDDAGFWLKKQEQVMKNPYLTETEKGKILYTAGTIGRTMESSIGK